MFVGRQTELRLLDDHLTRPDAGLFVVWGRRRIGKTALLRAAIRDRPSAAFHVGTRSTVTEELRRLSAELARSWELPLLERQPLTSWDALFELLAMVEGPRTLVLDEFPYLVEADPALPGLLQAAWDHTLSRRHLKLVVSGSSVGMMEETFFSPRAPLFGRRTGQLRVGPLGAPAVSDLLSLPAIDTLETLALFGGVPGYLVRLDPGVDAAYNLARHVLAPGEPLYDEIPFLLREELREPRVYQAVLAVIAGGASRFGEISSKVGLNRANLSRYLATLRELGLVEREVPVTERHPDKSRRGLYRIADPFVATWYRFLHPHRDRLERGHLDDVLGVEVEPRLPTWLGGAVEPVLADLVRTPGLVERLPFSPAHVGRHWRGDAEFDLVLLDADRTRAVVFEVKWSRRPISPGLLRRLRAKVNADPVLRQLETTVGLISRAGFRQPEAAMPDEAGLLLSADELVR
ncbi:MAG: ATP-binding protein [Myxococcota bacterium]